MIKDKTKKKKVNALSNETNRNQKKDSVPQHEDKRKKKKPIRPRNGNERIKKKHPMTKKECTLEAEVFVDLDHSSTTFDIFQTVTGINELPEIIVTETNRYTTQRLQLSNNRGCN